jgi:hypothetical protein
MLKRLNERARPFAAVVLMAVGNADAARSSMWQGAFQTTTTSGAMELQIKDGEPGATIRLRFAPDARPSEPEVRELRLTSQRISFATTLQTTPYRFDGTLHGRRWRGTVVATDGAGDRGTWTLSSLDLQDIRSSAQEPLPAPTGRYRTGRVAFDWIDENRPELETRATDDRRELLVYVFFPSRADPGAERVAYMPETEAMRDVGKEDLSRRLTSMRAHSRDTVALADGRERFPIVIFAPAGDRRRSPTRRCWKTWRVTGTSSPPSSHPTTRRPCNSRTGGWFGVLLPPSEGGRSRRAATMRPGSTNRWSFTGHAT